MADVLTLEVVDRETAIEPVEERALVPPSEFGVRPVLTAAKKQQLERICREYGIRPPRGWILVKQVPAAEITSGGIVIPDCSQRAEAWGIVVAVGQGTLHNGTLVAPEVEAGNHVKFPLHCGEEQEIDGEKLLMIREDEVMLIASGRRSEE